MEPLLSICMIVKDEEKVIRRCLESIVGIADEIIIVDTGSIDGTKDIAYEYTNSVFDYKWEDDFAKARNFSASKANGEWILVIDADEYVERKSFLQFKKDLKENPPVYNILAVQIVNFVGVNAKDTVLNYHERLYKNDGNIKYYRSIHEMLKHSKDKAHKGIIQLNIFHSGYMQNTIKEKDKSTRNLHLLKNKKEKEPIDYYFLGNEYYQLGNYDKAIWYYKKGYQLKENIGSDWVTKLLVRLVTCLHAAKRNEEALDIIKACEPVFNQLVDFRFLRAKIYFEEGKLNESINIFEEVLKDKEILVADTSIDFLEYLPHKYLGEAYEKTNELQLAVNHYSKAISINDMDDYVWMRLISLLAKHSSLIELTVFINNNCVNRRSMTSIRLIQILQSVPNINVQKLISSININLSKEEEEDLYLKDLFLAGKKQNVIEILNTKTLDQVVTVLSRGIFTFTDLVLLALDGNLELYKSILYNIKVVQPIGALLDLVFGNRKVSTLNPFEDSLLLTIIKQAEVMKLTRVTNLLKNRTRLLNKDFQMKLWEK